MALINFKNWELQEVRRARKCPIVDFGPLRESAIYKDVIAMGFTEVTPRQAELQGNLRFQHPEFNYVYRLNLNGRIWKDEPREEDSTEDSGKSIEILPEYNKGQTGKYFASCQTIEDYQVRLEFLVKSLLFKYKFINETEYLNDEAPNDLIMKKIEEDGANANVLPQMPPSLEAETGYLTMAGELGLFGDQAPKKIKAKKPALKKK